MDTVPQKDEKQNIIPEFGSLFNDIPMEVHRVNLDLEKVKMQMISLHMHDMAVSDNSFSIDGDMPLLRHYNENACVEMNFVMEGGLYQTHGTVLDKQLIDKGYHNVLFNPASWEQNDFGNSRDNRTVGIYLSPEKFTRLFSAFSPEFEDMAEKVHKGTPFVKHQPRNTMSARLRNAINALWLVPDNMSLRKLYLESKVMEIMALQFESFSRAQHTDTQSVLKGPDDIEKLYQARDILVANAAAPPTLGELSRLCGLNEFKLKKGFKEVFNQTVFGYLNDHRLENARLMIQDTRKTVSEIAYETGYANPQHFHRAFRKQYGIAPGILRK